MALVVLDSRLWAVPLHEQPFGFAALLQAPQSVVDHAFERGLVLAQAERQRLGADALLEQYEIFLRRAELSVCVEQRNLVIDEANGLALLKRDQRLRRSFERDDLNGGRAIPAVTYELARRFADEWRWRCSDAISEFDAVLSPSTLGVPPSGLESTGDPLFCRPWTLFGFPALAIPAAWTPDGLPAGVQLTTTAHSDRRLLEVANWLGKAGN